MMSSFYQKMLSTLKKYHLDNIIVKIAKILPYIIALLYVILLIYCFIYQRSSLTNAIIKPLASFLIVTVIRKLYNRPRPCITMNITPLYGHKTDESCPSRHTVSAFAIALAIYSLFPHLGIIVLCLALLVGISRILCGVHHISDVILAILIAFIIAYI